MLATAGDLVFTGDPEGYFFALDAKHGREAVEFSDRRGTSRVGDFLQRERTAVYCDADGVGSIAGRAHGVDLAGGGDFRGGSTLMVFALPEGASMRAVCCC